LSGGTKGRVGLASEESRAGWRGGGSVNHGGGFGPRCSQRLPDAKGGVVLKDGTPLCIELFAGTMSWSAGWLALGGRAIGFDIEHLPHHGPVPPGAELVLQDVRTLHGRQFKDADLLLFSPPCQNYSHMAMPFSHGKREASWQRWQRDSPFSPGFHLNDLFDACFRIQREASEAAGRYIPMVVENVNGAQPWVGRAKARYGSFFLWGDVNSIGGAIVAGPVRFGEVLRARKGLKLPGNNSAIRWEDREIQRRKDATDERREALEDGRKVPGFNFHQHENGEPGGSFQSAAVAEGRKTAGMNWSDRTLHGQDFTRIAGQQATNNNGGSWFGIAHNTKGGNGQNPVTGEGGKGFARRFEDTPMARVSSKSDSRRAASAQIAKIPPALSSYIARAFWPLTHQSP
jgi:hypothetical protein